jgi:hypothetical protein
VALELNGTQRDHVLFRRAGFRLARFGLRLDFEEALGFPDPFADAFLELRFFAGLTRSGSLAPPVSRFHSSNVCSEISPFTSSSANLRRWALLLNGIVGSRPDAVQVRNSHVQLTISPVAAGTAPRIPWNPRRAQHDSPYVSIVTYAVRDLGRRCRAGRL